LGRRVDEKIYEVMRMYRARVELCEVAYGPPVNQHLVSLIGPINDQLIREMERILELHSIMMELSTLIHDDIAVLMRQRN